MDVSLTATGAYLPGGLATFVRDVVRAGPAVQIRLENALRK